MAASQLILSLDVGTTAIKVGLFCATGELLQVAVREQTLSFPAPDRVEQSPAVAWNLLAEGVREVLAGRDPRSVAAVTLANHRGTAIALDAEGNPLTEFIVWMDKRGLPWVDWLRQTVGPDRYYQTAGHPIVSYSGITKLLWLQHEAPEIWEKTRVVGPPQTLFLKWLGCDELLCDRSSGTFTFPFDIDRQAWSEDLAAAIGYPVEKLPRLVGATDIVGHLSPRAAAHFGLPPGIPLVAGGGDGQCAGVGSGVIQQGRVMINLGTGTGVQAFLPRPLRDPGQTLNCAAHVVSGAWEMEGHTQASGAAFRWLRDVFGVVESVAERELGLNAYELLIEQAKHVPPGADGLLFLPTFNGSSAPVVDLTARGALLGLSLRHERGHIIRAMLEGISLEVRWMLDAMIDLGTEVEEIRFVGGGARNPVWNKIHASILNRPIKILDVTDAAMVGAAMCAAVGIGALDWPTAADRFVREKATVEPDPDAQAAYAGLYQNYRDAFLLLSRDGLFRRLV